MDTLHKDHLPAVTLAKLLAAPQTQRQLSTRSVIVLDEAGAVGLDDMAKVFDLALRARCRVVMSGDTGQHASVPRGDALRILEQYSRYRFAELTTIRRQKPEAFRQAVELAAAKQTHKALAKLEQLGAITETPNDDGQLHRHAADAYLSATQQGRSALLVAPTWAEIDAVTREVRDKLKTAGLVSLNDETVTVFESLSWTTAQKQSAHQYEPGLRLRFIRATKPFARGETVEVAGVEGSTLKLRRADGSEACHKLGRGSACFDVGEARELHVAAGDWLLLQANHGKEFVNGERVQVREIRRDRIALVDGRQLSAGFNTFTHGYAVTSHSSQSKTVDEVLVVASSKSFAAVSQEQFYVSISRGRERVHIFTDDSETLRRRVADSRERKAAIELQSLRDDLAKLGFLPSPRSLPRQKPDALQRFRNIRQQRQTRPTRMSLSQRLVQWADELRRWLADKLGIQVQNS